MADTNKPLLQIQGLHASVAGNPILRGVDLTVDAGQVHAIMDFFGVPATARASFALYNTPQEVEALVAGIEDVRRMFC